jgi:hypothetical protein
MQPIVIGIDSVNGNDNFVGTLTAPVKTWDAAYQLYLNRRSSELSAPPRFVDVNTTGGSTLEVTQSLYSLGSDGDAGPPAIIGVPKDSGLGSLTIASVGTATLYGTSVSRFVIAGAAFTTRAYQGRRWRFTSGAYAGQSFDINSNDTTGLVLQLPLSGVNPNDTGVIESCGTVINVTSAVGTIILGDPSVFAVCFRMQVPSVDLEFIGNPQLGFVEYDHNQQAHTQFVWDKGMVAMHAQFSRGVPGLPATDFDCTFYIHGSTGDGSMWLRDGCVFLMPGGVFVDATLLISGASSYANFDCYPTFYFTYAWGEATIVLNTLTDGAKGAVFVSINTDIYNPGPGNGIEMTAATLVMQLDTSIVTGGDGLVLKGGSKAFIGGVVGTMTGAGKVGIRTTDCDFVQIDDSLSGIPTTVTGPGGDVVVGDNAPLPNLTATATYAQIRAGTPAACTALGSLCRVRA